MDDKRGSSIKHNDIINLKLVNDYSIYGFPKPETLLWNEKYEPKSSKEIECNVSNNLIEWLNEHKQDFIMNQKLAQLKTTIIRKGITLKVNTTQELKKLNIKWDQLSKKEKKEKVHRFVTFAIYRLNKELIDDEITIIVKYINLLFKRAIQSNEFTNNNGAIIYGQSGIGKSTYVRLIAEELGFDIVDIEPSDLATKTIKELINISNTTTILTMMHKNKPKLLLIDPLTKLYDRNNIANIIKIANPLKGIRSSTKVDKEKREAELIPPIICICNEIEYSSKKITEIRKEFNNLYYKVPSKSYYTNIIKNIMKNEDMAFDENQQEKCIDAIIKISGNDIRQLVSVLKSLFDKFKHAEIIIQDIQQDEKNIKDDLSLTPLDITTRLFHQKKYTLENLYNFYDVDENYQMLAIYENYPESIHSFASLHRLKKQDKIKIINDVAEIAENLSMADPIATEIHGKQHWELFYVHGYYSLIKPYSIFKKYNNSSYNVKPPTRAYKNYNKNTHLDTINKIRACMPIAYNTFIHYNNNCHDITYLHILRSIFLKLLFGNGKKYKPNLEAATNMMRYYNLNAGDVSEFIRIHTFRNEEYRQKFTAKFKKDLENLTEKLPRFENKIETTEVIPHFKKNTFFI